MFNRYTYMNFPKKTLLASLLMISASSALAVDTLTVTGTIDPPGCEIRLVGGVIDYGDITLAESGPTTLPDKTVTYSVDCGTAPAPISLSWEDNNSVGSGTGSFGIKALDGGAAIGSYAIEQIETSSIVDGSTSHLLQRQSGGANWGVVAGTSIVVSEPGLEITHALTETIPGAPTPGIIFTGEYVVKSTLNEGLNVGDGVTLDGKATVTVTRL